MCRRIEKSSPNPLTPKIRFNEQAIQLTANHCRKARDFSVKLGDDDLPIGDLRRRQVDRVGKGQKLGTIVRQLKRCAALQIFERLLLLGPRGP